MGIRKLRNQYIVEKHPWFGFWVKAEDIEAINPNNKEAAIQKLKQIMEDKCKTNVSIVRSSETRGYLEWEEDTPQAEEEDDWDEFITII